MSRSAIAVANLMIDISNKKAIKDLTPMKLQKLLYYTQGWCLGVDGNEAFHEQIEAWRYGPVVQSIYDSTKEYGNGTITQLLVSQDEKAFGVGVPEVLDGDEMSELKPVLKWILEQYGSLSGIQLSNMTHAEGGPWAIIMEKYEGDPLRNTDIPIEIIKKHFQGEFAKILDG
jgi:uncharacterized phage-associated protein